MIFGTEHDRKRSEGMRAITGKHAEIGSRDRLKEPGIEYQYLSPSKLLPLAVENRIVDWISARLRGSIQKKEIRKQKKKKKKTEKKILAKVLSPFGQSCIVGAATQ